MITCFFARVWTFVRKIRVSSVTLASSRPSRYFVFTFPTTVTSGQLTLDPESDVSDLRTASSIESTVMMTSE